MDFINSSVFKLLQENTSMGISVCELVVDTNNNISKLLCLYANNKMAECLGKTIDELQGNELSNEKYNFVEEVKQISNDIRPLLVTEKEVFKVEIIKDEKISNQIIIILHCVTAYINYYKKQLIEKVQTQYLSFTENSNVPMMISNLNTLFDYNEAYVKLLGFDNKEDIMKIAPHELSPKYQPDGRLSTEVMFTEIEKAKENGFCHFEWIAYKKDRTEISVEINLNYNLLNGKPFINAIVKDLTKSKALENEFKKEQERLINELSIPITPLLKDIILVPLVGTLTEKRANLAVNIALKKIATNQSRVIIIDISGVNAIDIELVLVNIIKLAKATSLMGCTAIISGMSGKIAEKIVELDINIGELNSTASLENALYKAFDIIGIKLELTKN